MLKRAIVPVAIAVALAGCGSTTNGSKAGRRLLAARASVESRFDETLSAVSRRFAVSRDMAEIGYSTCNPGAPESDLRYAWSSALYRLPATSDEEANAIFDAARPALALDRTVRPRSSSAGRFLTLDRQEPDGYVRLMYNRDGHAVFLSAATSCLASPYGAPSSEATDMSASGRSSAKTPWTNTSAASVVYPTSSAESLVTDVVVHRTDHAEVDAAIVPSGSTKKLPGCGSAWKEPWPKTIRNETPAAARASLERSRPVASSASASSTSAPRVLSPGCQSLRRV